MTRHYLDQARESFRLADGTPDRKAQQRFNATVRAMDSMIGDDMRDAEGRVDAQSAIYVARQLEHVFAEAYEEEFPELPGATGEVLPIDSSVPEGAKNFRYYLYSSVGIARFASGYSGDLALVSRTGATVTGNCELIENGYEYSREDLRNAAQAQDNLDGALALSARRGHDEQWHRTCLWGNEDLGLPGLFNHPNITVTDAADNGSGSTLWSAKTPSQIIADVRVLINTVNQVTKGREKVTRVYMSEDEYDLISTLQLSNGNDGLVTTVLQFLENTYGKRGIEFKPLIDLRASDSDGNLSTNALFAYTHNDKRKASFVVPMPFQQHSPQEAGNKFLVPCESKVGGVKMPAPLMAIRMDNVGNS